MRVKLGGDVRENRVVDLRAADVAPAQVAAAVRDPDDDRVRCPEPGPAHRHVGCIAPDVSLERRVALAAVARSRGETAPQDDELAAVREELASLSADGTDLTAAREQVADAAGERERRRERVATLRGRLQARREAGLDTRDAEAALAEAAREFSEAATEHAAAEQALDRARERARAAYDARERRLRLQDRRDNLRREARSHLVEAVRPAVRDALSDLPGATAAPDDATDPDDAIDSDDATDPAVALAAARVAALDAPAVVAWGPFTPREAADWLDAPVVVL